MPSTIDQRRLSDGATALAVSSKAPQTIDEVHGQLEIVSAAIAALQSLDDLGTEANERAERDQQELWKRHEALKKRLMQLGGKGAS